MTYPQEAPLFRMKTTIHKGTVVEFIGWAGTFENHIRVTPAFKEGPEFLACPGEYSGSSRCQKGFLVIPGTDLVPLTLAALDFLAQLPRVEP
jgi:hypothetical protein